MKKTIFGLLIAIVFGIKASAQGNVWNEVTRDKLSALVRERDNGVEEGERYFTVDIATLKNTLQHTTDKFSGQAGILVGFPNLEGTLEVFEVWENSNMEPAFQARFPEIRAYVGKGITDKTAQINFSMSPLGVQTMVIRAGYSGAEFIERYDKAASAYVLFTSAARVKKPDFHCMTVDDKLISDIKIAVDGIANKSSNAVYKTLRLALSCTAEYANYFGATSSSQQNLVLAGMNATMTRVNGVYEKDLSVHLNMIDNSSFVYYDPSTDPYSAVVGADSNGNGFDDGMDNWNLELMNALHVTPGDSAFDIGHLFGASGGGGNAGCIGCVCLNTLSTTTDSYGVVRPVSYKGSGITSPSNAIPVGDFFDVDFVAHEMGHQLGGNHSFTYGYEGTVAQVEPGSGSTIMGYAGVTSYDVQAHSDPIFCYRNIVQIQSNLNSKTCPISTSLTGTNATPTANAGADYTIPIGTAFVLTGTASDADSGDVLTYLWEEDNKGSSSTTAANSRVLATKTAGPNWRTFKPSTKAMRYFPQMGKILAGVLTNTSTTSNSNWESCSTVARTLDFDFTVRDNHVGAGQTQTDAMKITVSTTGGAFSVSSQSTTGISYQGNSTQTVTWVPGSTASAPYNSPTVDILLSTNVSTSLETYNSSSPTSPNSTTWTTIASGVPNNGSYDVTLPDVATTTSTCRFMVKAVGNVFLAVNAKNFTITPSLANNQFGLNNFSIFPNPNNGNFTIRFDSNSSNDIKISVVDMRGRQVFGESYTNNGFFNQNIQLSGLQTGMYLVTVQDGDQKEVKKIMIE